MLAGHSGSIRAVAVNDKWVVTDNNFKARLWDLEQPEAEPIVLGESVMALNHKLLVTRSDSEGRLWDLEQSQAEVGLRNGN